VEQPSGELRRQFGFWQATALNVTMIVGAGVFITIPFMLKALPGPWALLGWLVAGALILVDGLIWAELGAALPGSGGSYLYLLESYGKEGWGKLMAFLFIWQFMISGPLELASGLIAMDTFSQPLSADWAAFNKQYTWRLMLWEARDLAVTFSPARLGVVAVGGVLVLLLYRNVTALARLAFVFFVAVLGVIGWVLVEGWSRFDPAVAFDYPTTPTNFATGLGAAMTLALYSYLGYYNICYVGDEVRNPGRTIPRAILVSALLVVVLFTLTHLAMLGTVSWRDVPTTDAELGAYSLPAAFMGKLHGDWAVKLISACLMGSCFASVFAGMLGYSRIPFAAARAGHFFAVVGKVHPTLQIPHVSLLLVGGMTLFWSFFDLGAVITALITTRILEQFVAQVIGVMILRRARPDLPRPFRIWLYPLPCLLALLGWLYVYCTADVLYIVLGLVTLLLGAAVYFVWSAE
jgi:basic amino acid/polyamine antiporter, APA family